MSAVDQCDRGTAAIVGAMSDPATIQKAVDDLSFNLAAEMQDVAGAVTAAGNRTVEAVDRQADVLSLELEALGKKLDAILAALKRMES